MPRWIQHPITHKMIPAEEYVRPKEANHSVHGDIEAFVSPVDGTLIDDRKKLREHNEKNGVVSWNEYSPEYLEKAQNKRRDFFEGKRSPQEIRKNKEMIYENWVKAERNEL